MLIASGVNAAVGTPRRPDGTLDEVALERSIEFVVERDVIGLALNGATGEYPLTTPEELRRILRIGARAAATRAALICGVGAAGIDGVLERGRIAADAGVQALLLPVPHFFPYQQDDVIAFVGEVAGKLPLPILLYNLPQFTTGYEPATVMSLLDAYPNVMGIKDSSGKLDTLRRMTVAGSEASRIVGNDGVLAQALRERVCDGVISGVASVAPELITGLFHAPADRVDAATRALGEFVAQLDPFPTPWGLKWIGEARGIAPATFAQSLSARRREQGQALREWFLEWWERSGVAVNGTLASQD